MKYLWGKFPIGAGTYIPQITPGNCTVSSITTHNYLYFGGFFLISGTVNVSTTSANDVSVNGTLPPIAARAAGFSLDTAIGGVGNLYVNSGNLSGVCEVFASTSTPTYVVRCQNSTNSTAMSFTYILFGRVNG